MMATWLVDGPGSAWLGLLGWSLLHFIWQGVLVGLLFAIVMPLLARASAQLRYIVALGFLLALGACLPATFWLLAGETGAAHAAGSVAATMQQFVVQAAPATQQSVIQSALFLLERLAPWTVLAWAIGVILTSSRLFADWQRVRRLVANGQPASDPALARIMADVARSLGLKRAVRLLESAAVEVPVVIGWLKPVVLVPTSALLGLDPRQLELILVHELAHVRRGDYLVNLIQVAIETLLFYHPVVRWVSDRVRQERENCCDDLVVATSQDRLAYARALLELEGLRGLAVSAVLSSAGGNLAGRIRRIVGMPPPQRGAADWIAGVALTALGVAGLGIDSISQPDPDRAGGTLNRAGEIATIDAAQLVAFEPGVQRIVAPVPPAVAQQPRIAVDSQALAAEKNTTDAAATAWAGRGPNLDDGAAGAAPAESVRSQAPVIAAPSVATPAAESQPGRVSAVGPLPAVETAPVLAAVKPEVQALPPIDRFQRDPAGQGPDLGTPGAGVDVAAPVEPRITGGELIRAEPPSYPASARHSGHQGYVVVEYTVTRNGRVRDIEIVDTGHRDLFSRAAVQAVRSWRYEPFRIDGQAVEKRVTRRFSFVLDGADPQGDDGECVLLTGTRLCR
jgi:TonB family protein